MRALLASLLLLFRIAGCSAVIPVISSIDYRFSFTETNVDDFSESYFIDVGIQIVYLADGTIQFGTNVFFESQYWFSMYVNGVNCGLLNQKCNVKLYSGQKALIQLFKIDMQSNLVEFTFIAGQPTVLRLLGCPKTLNGGDCVSSYQYVRNLKTDQYQDKICFCNSSSTGCSSDSSNDSCVTNTSWWELDANETSTILPTSSTTQQLTTTPLASTVTTTSLETSTPTTTEAQTTTVSTTTATTESTTTTITTTTTEVPTTTETTVTSSTNTPSEPTSTSVPLKTTTLPDDSFPTLKNLSDSGVDINNVTTVLNDTLTYSQMGPDLNTTQVQEISIILSNCAKVPGLKAENSFSILQNLDNVLKVGQDIMYRSNNSADLILQMLPNMVHNTIDERVEYLEGMNLGFSSKKINCSNITSDDGLLDLGTRFELINSTDNLSNLVKNSIMIPLVDLCSSQDFTHVYFTIYRDQSLFGGSSKYQTYNSKSVTVSKRAKRSVEYEYDDEEGENPEQIPIPSPCDRQISLPATPILSATLLNNGLMVRASTPSESSATYARLYFNTSGILKPLHGSIKVTWWDEGRKEWAQNQECLIVSNNNGIIEAQCNHLTDFAIIVDAALNDPNVCDRALIDLGYVVNSISIASLAFLTFFSISSYIQTLARSRFYLFFRGHSLARKDLLALFYHLDLLLFYVFFTIFANQAVSGGMCTTLAAVMYAFLLCSLFFTMFQILRNLATFMPAVCFRYFSIFLATPTILAISIVTPFIISLCLLVFSTFFDRQDCFCWVRPDYVIFAIVLPVSFLLMSSMICTSFMIYKIFCGATRKFSKSGNLHYDPNTTTKIISIIIMQISMGLPWILQFGTLYSPYTTFWHYCFTIVMGSQGTILLFIFIYKRWRVQQSESMRSTSYKTVKKRKKADLEQHQRRAVVEQQEEEESVPTSSTSSDTFYEY